MGDGDLVPLLPDRLVLCGAFGRFAYGSSRTGTKGVLIGPRTLAVMCVFKAALHKRNRGSHEEKKLSTIPLQHGLPHTPRTHPKKAVLVVPLAASLQRITKGNKLDDSR